MTGLALRSHGQRPALAVATAALLSLMRPVPAAAKAAEDLPELRLRAARGLATHQAQLAHRYYRGQGLRRDLPAARRWAQRAADQEHPVGAFILALIDNDASAPNAADVLPALRQLAGAGDPLAAAYLGVAYAHGVGVNADPAAAVSWLRRAGREPMAQAELAFLYTIGQGVGRNLKKAFKLYRSAAKADDIEAQYMLGGMLLDGLGSKPDPAGGQYWLTCAADAGHAAAQYRLGRLAADTPSAPGGGERAATWFRQAAMQHYPPAEEAFAWRLYNGDGVATDPAAAADWFYRAATHGRIAAQRQLAWMYYRGDGIGHDPTRARHWYRQAATAGDAEAQYMLSWLLAAGDGVAADPAAAAQWCRQAAAQGHLQAQFNLGAMLDRGDGVPRDLAAARSWYERAAHHGMARAQFNLAHMYARGDGVAPNRLAAFVWYSLAAKNGSLAAWRKARQLEPTLTPAERTAAQTRIAACLSSGAAADRAATGWVSPTGFVVTTYSVVQDRDTARVWFSPLRSVAAPVVRRSAALNLAVHRPPNRRMPPGLAAAKIAARPGDAVLAGVMGDAHSMPHGPHFFPAEVGADDAGKADRRFVVIRFADPRDTLAGAPVINARGELVGMLMTEAAAVMFAAAEPTRDDEICRALRGDIIATALASLPPAREPRRVARELDDFEQTARRATRSIVRVTAEAGSGDRPLPTTQDQ